MNGFDSAKANIVLCHNPDVCDLDVWGDYEWLDFIARAYTRWTGQTAVPSRRQCCL